MPVKPETLPGDRGLRDLAARLNTVVVHLNRELRRTDLALGLPTAQASALALLATAGRHTISDLANFEHVSGPTMTRIVAALEKRGLAARVRSTDDLRVVFVEATDPGRELITAGLANRLARLEEGLASFEPEEIQTLRSAADLLRRLTRPATTP